MNKIIKNSPEYRRAVFNLAIHHMHIIQCADCGYPTLYGNRCESCDSDFPEFGTLDVNDE